MPRLRALVFGLALLGILLTSASKGWLSFTY